MAGRNVRPLVCLGILLIYCEYTELDMDSVKNEQFNKSIGKTFIKYLLAAFGAVLTTSIYAFVDTVVIGQYEGEVGTAAVSCVMLIWNVFIGTGILFGIGGSVMYSVTRGKGEARKANAFFTASFIACVAVAAVLYVVFLVFQREILWFFGAKETAVLEKAQLYVGWIAYVMPLFVLGQYFIAFIRNDGNPVLTTVAVVSGGAFNIFGDIFFVFGLDMGISGAGLATMIGQVIAFCILLLHFPRKKNTLRFVRVEKFFKSVFQSIKGGFAPFIVDFSFGILVIMFNNRIMQVGGSVELAVFGAVSTTMLLLQSLFYGVGQALQPIVSYSYGAGDDKAVKAVLRYALIAAGIMSVLFFTLDLALTEPLTKIYIGSPSEETLKTSIFAFRVYSLVFVLMGFNVTLGYYFQSILKSAYSVTISLLRGIVLCSAFLYLFTGIFGVVAVWWVMPAAESVTFVVTAVLLLRARSIAKRAER